MPPLKLLGEELDRSVFVVVNSDGTTKSSIKLSSCPSARLLFCLTRAVRRIWRVLGQATLLAEIWLLFFQTREVSG